MIEILSPTQLPRAREAGAFVADVLQTLKRRSAVGTNLMDIDEWARAMIVGAGAESCYVDYAPSFGRGPFGHYICTSVNDAVLHGRPHDYALADGDLLSLDLAVSTGGVVADSAISFVVGDSRPAESVAMIDATERALSAGIAAAGPGAAGRRHLARHRWGPLRGGLSGQHRVRRSRRRLDDAPGPAHRRMPGGRVVATRCGPGCCWLSSLGSWPTPPSSSPMPTGGRSGVRPDAAPPTASTRSPSPATGRRSSPCPARPPPPDEVGQPAGAPGEPRSPPTVTSPARRGQPAPRTACRT